MPRTVQETTATVKRAVHLRRFELITEHPVIPYVNVTREVRATVDGVTTVEREPSERVPFRHFQRIKLDQLANNTRQVEFVDSLGKTRRLPIHYLLPFIEAVAEALE